jgi:DNA polymerase-3 subunit gamma/tau
MKRLSLLVLLAGCTAAPPAIVDYNTPYTGKYAPPVVSPRPEPRTWLPCPKWPDDCGGEVYVASYSVDPADPVDPPVLDPGVDGPDEPVREPEPPAVEPEPEPEKPPHEPPPEHPKGNASANNGKGGNYHKTGHIDNGKGRP